MKTSISFGKRLLALSLAMVYVFAISTYIIFLSSRTPVHHHHRHSATAQVQHLSACGAAGNFYDKPHGAFKSTFNNKRKVIIAMYSLVCLAVFALVPALRLFCVNRLTDAITGLIYAGRPCYLSLRVLRI